MLSNGNFSNEPCGSFCDYSEVLSIRYYLQNANISLHLRPPCGGLSQNMLWKCHIKRPRLAEKALRER